MSTSYAGVDYSIGGPAICIHPTGIEWNVKNCKFVFLTGTKCRQKVFKSDDIEFHGVPFIKDYTYDTERFEHNAQVFIKTMEMHNVIEAMLEGYAYGGKGKVFNLAEATGLLKYFLVQLEIPFTSNTPPVIKKFATGKGNAGKPLMVSAFKDDTGIDLIQLFELSSITGPADDIADAYFICKLLHDINN